MGMEERGVIENQVGTEDSSMRSIAEFHFPWPAATAK
jgi:hypothetical protein